MGVEVVKREFWGLVDFRVGGIRVFLGSFGIFRFRVIRVNKLGL